MTVHQSARECKLFIQDSCKEWTTTRITSQLRYATCYDMGS
jgi:hypothetical protein